MRTIAYYILLFESSLNIFEFLHNIMDDILLRIIFSVPSPRIFVIVGLIISVWKKCDGFWIYIWIYTYIPNHKTGVGKIRFLDCCLDHLLHDQKLLLLLLLFWSPLCKAGREWGHSISPKTPTPHNQPWKEEKDKTVRDKKERADHANKKVLVLLLKPGSPTPSNTGSLRSFQRDTESGTKLLRYWKHWKHWKHLLPQFVSTIQYNTIPTNHIY